MRAGGGILKHSDDSDVIAMQLETTCYGKNEEFIRDLGFKPWLAVSWLWDLILVCSTFLGFSFLTCKMGIINSRIAKNIKTHDVCASAL